MARRVPISAVSHLGLAVRDTRHGRGLTQRDLADLAGLDQATISRMESRHSSEQLNSLIDTLRSLGGRMVIEFDDDQPVAMQIPEPQGRR